MDTNVSENEETEKETNKTKVSDSGYSNSCSNNSQSQRSNSSKSQHSTSSGSSGYCGHPSTLGSGDDNHKKKKAKLQVATGENGQEEAEHDSSLTPPHSADQAVEIKTTPACVDPSVLDNMSSPTMESEALQVAVVAQTLFCIKTNAAEQALDDEEMMTSSPEPVSKEPQTTDMIIGALKTEIKHEKEFCIVVALSDGTVVCTTPSLTNVLGFPKDMWIGRSLINFLHPKDRIAFASHITSAMGHSHFKQKCTNVGSSEKGDDSDYFYCWIRLYNGLRTSGFSVADRKAAYLSCQLSMNFKEVPDQGVFLVATARLVKPAYKAPNESRSNPPTFTIRHTANTLISHVDNDIVPHFGYLPHDMIGRSIFDFYYAEDLAYLKDVYTNVIMEEGLLFLSRPYKFRCQNGDCVMVETEWSSFINPWGKKLEFIIGRHRVLTGPQNPDVVSPVLDFNKTSNNEEEPNVSKVFEEEIKALLTEPIVRCYEPSKDQLAQLVESLEKISSSQLQDQSTGLPAPMPSATSEMLGEISPHHVYSDSKSSSETPSYNQLTYNENIQRFFASEPKTAGSDESQATKNETNQSSSSGGEEQKSLPIDSSFNSNSDSCLNESGKSSEPCSNNARVDWAKPESSTRSKETEIASINDQYKSRPLTEKLLYQHNENMNKQMAQNHKKEKNKGQINRKHKIFRNKTLQEIEQEEQGGHGMKRSVSHSWEGEPMKAFKGAHQGQATLLSDSVHPRLPPLPPNLSSGVWPAPPFPVAVTLPPPAQPLAGHLNYSNPLVNPIMQLPCVYMNPLQPAAQPTSVCGARPRASEHPGPPLHRAPIQVPAPQPYMAHQVQYMPSLMYQLPLVPMVYTQPHIIPPTIKPRMTLLPTIGDHMTTLPQVMSDCNKKEKTFHASFPVYSPGFTSPTGKTKSGTYDNDLTHDDTSFCSYSSLFPKTEKSDDSMKDSQDKQNVGQYKMWRGTTGSDSSAALKTLRKEPSWMENIDVTPDLMLRYQMGNCILSQVLQSDFEALLKFNQPEMVNEQLDQLYVDLEGLSKQLSLEESFPSSCSSGDEKHQAGMPSTSTSTYVKTKKKFMGYDKCAMIFEEDAPMPPSAIELLVGGAHSS